MSEDALATVRQQLVDEPEASFAKGKIWVHLLKHLEDFSTHDHTVTVTLLQFLRSRLISCLLPRGDPPGEEAHELGLVGESLGDAFNGHVERIAAFKYFDCLLDRREALPFLERGGHRPDRSTLRPCRPRRPERYT